MDYKLFLSTFGLIFIAELPDKTTFANLLMGARFSPLAVVLGTCAAFIVHSAIAVAAGNLARFLPARLVEVFVGCLFLILAVHLWRQKIEQSLNPEVPRHVSFRKAVAIAFGITFLAQWGDMTQILTAALAAKYAAPWTIFISATLALWAVNGGAVLVGHFAKGRVHPHVSQKVVSAILGTIGAVLLVQAFRNR